MLRIFFKKKQKIIKNPFIRFSREIIYGGLDGIITTFAVIAGFTGAQSGNTANLTISTVLLFSFANLFSDASSMALGNLLSARTEIKKNLNKHINQFIDNPFFTSIATFLSFITFGMIPIIPYLFFKGIDTTDIFYIACLLSGFSLIVLGVVRMLITKESWYKSIGEVAIIGGSSASIAYIVGTFFKF